jgi:hypothetical protein
VANPDGQVELTWRTAPGRRYRVRTALQVGQDWVWTLENEQLAAGDTLKSVDPSPPNSGTKLYQVLEVP